MLILVATEQLGRLLPRQEKPPRLARRESPPVIAGASLPNHAAIDVPKGMRYQIFRALRAMDRGEAMVVERKIPPRSDLFENASKREAWFSLLRNVSSWEGENTIEPVLVPGTSFPYTVGRIMLRSGWCAPSDQPHWVPNLRLFFLTRMGHESFSKAQAWWSELPPLERMRLMFLE